MIEPKDGRRKTAESHLYCSCCQLILVLWLGLIYLPKSKGCVMQAAMELAEPPNQKG